MVAVDGEGAEAARVGRGLLDRVEDLHVPGKTTGMLRVSKGS